MHPQEVFVHLVKPFSTAKNITLNSMSEWAKHPLGEEHLCLVGEAWAGWIAGWANAGLVSTQACIEGNFMDVLSPEAIADFKYQKAGCDGATSFANEVFPMELLIPGKSASDAMPEFETYYHFKH
jgi:hypothetical protein